MEIIRFDPQTLQFGEDAYRCFIEVEKLGLSQFRGRRAIVGAIRACIKNGVVRHEDIVYTVARITGCIYTTIATIIREFTGSDPDLHFWTYGKNQTYSLLDDSRARPAGVRSVWITN